MAMRIILILTASYLLAGLLFGAAFLTRGVDRVDHGARGASWGFRLLILPGVAALWPVLAVKWRVAASRARSATQSPEQASREGRP